MVVREAIWNYYFAELNFKDVSRNNENFKVL